MSESLIRYGIYGSRLAEDVGDINLFALKGVDLITRQMYFQQWDRRQHINSCLFSPEYVTNSMGVICCNGMTSRPRADFTIQGLKDYINGLAREFNYPEIPNGILSVMAGRPYLASAMPNHAENFGYILKGYRFIERHQTTRLNEIGVNRFGLTGRGFYIAPTIPQIKAVLEAQVGLLCDPYAPKELPKKGGMKQLAVPFPDFA